MLSSDNPWLSGVASRQPDHTKPDDVERSQPSPHLTGPAAPQPAVPMPDAVDRLPRRAVSIHAPVWWVGTHGGAGESTLAQLLPGSLAAGHAWPQLTAATGDLTTVKVVLVARSNLAGLSTAQRAATEWAARAVTGVDLVGLVIIADAPGRLPRPLKDLAALVAGAVPRVWHLPWSEAWRVGEVQDTSSSKEVRRLLADVRELVPQTHAAYRGTN